MRAALRAAQAHAPRAALAAAAIAAPVRGCADLCLSDHRLVGRLLGALAHGHHGHGCGERRVEGARVGLAARGRGRCGSGAGGCRRSLRVAAAARGLLRWVQRVAAGGEGGLGCREGLDASSWAAGCRTIGSIPFARMNRKISAIQGKRSQKMHRIRGR